MRTSVSLVLLYESSFHFLPSYDPTPSSGPPHPAYRWHWKEGVAVLCNRVWWKGLFRFKLRGMSFIWPIPINISRVVQHTTFSAHIRLSRHLFSNFWPIKDQRKEIWNPLFKEDFLDSWKRFINLIKNLFFPIWFWDIKRTKNSKILRKLLLKSLIDNEQGFLYYFCWSCIGYWEYKKISKKCRVGEKSRVDRFELNTHAS